MIREKTKKKTKSKAVRAWSFVMKLLSFHMPVFSVDCRLVASHRLPCGTLPDKKALSKNASKRTTEHASTTSNIAYRFIGYPDKEQTLQLEQTIGSYRWLWNRMKSDRDTLYNEMGIVVKNTPADYKDLDECAWLKSVDSYALCNVQLNLEKAYSDFLSGKAGFPRFKKKHICRASYTTNKDKRSNNILLSNGRLTLPRIPGTIRLKCHRNVPEHPVLKACTVCHEPNGKWTFTLLYEYPLEETSLSDKIEQFLKTGDDSCIRHIGLDMSLGELYVDSDGCLPGYEVNDVFVGFRKCYRGLESKIAKEQHKLSKMQRDSNNYRKQCVKIAKLHAKAKQRRSDFLHQVAVRLARAYDVISIEDLDMSAMKQSLKFGKSVSDNGWGTFIRILEEKCEQYGCLLVKVGKWFPSSKTCSHCGHIHKELKLSDRTYICPECGHVMDRDYQAAVNLDREGLRILVESFGKEAA